MNQTMVFQKVNLCEEEPVDFLLNGKRMVTFMCTLKNLRELAVGYLYSQGIIKDLFFIGSQGYGENIWNYHCFY